MLLPTTAGAQALAPWFESGRPTDHALRAAEMLVEAASHGLDPADYDAIEVRRALMLAMLDPQEPEPGARARLAETLERQLRRYLDDLANGRVDPGRVHSDFSRAEPSVPAQGPALDARSLQEAVRAATAGLPGYERLRGFLAQYRALIGDPAWGEPLPEPRVAVEPGAEWEGVAVLAQRLRALGDLAVPAAEVPAVEAASSGRYDGHLVEAVKNFQRRHGLSADGIIGPRTLAELQVPPRARVRQIELTLERLRWTPLMQASRMVVVNVPEFVLRGYEIEGGEIRMRVQMRVVVGESVERPTPLFDETMRSLQLNPYWNVPFSIARDELVPRFRRDPERVAREGFEFVASGGIVHQRADAQSLAAVLDGSQRIRQRPGARNALGAYKFIFPNATNIFLHDTPQTSLFERDRRDFSHGCIRVEDPAALAEFVLQGTPGWSGDEIREAVASGQTINVQLAQPLPVLIAYGTVVPTDSEVRFYRDIYGYDAQLEQALREVSAQRRAEATTRAVRGTR